ncbi:MAG TPA: hypothetical protein PLN52_23750 [Opitutaceae bacterium]|nr:hypothetical protein [Opitutaceae bacterium]
MKARLRLSHALGAFLIAASLVLSKEPKSVRLEQVLFDRQAFIGQLPKVTPVSINERKGNDAPLSEIEKALADLGPIQGKTFGKLPSEAKRAIVVKTVKPVYPPYMRNDEVNGGRTSLFS